MKITTWTFCLFGVAAAVEPACDANNATCSLQLLQKRAKLDKTLLSTDTEVMEGRVANPLLAYYQRWAAG
eukprot:CAMPEP_0197910872 /NCGR_PEP_ID=MMETSP1439-20131203/71734_1 /TAXON_ID=66791 /ORGANISM="Gonyaulax spinifera, Strain CCMP409" /LENGTH=69 /DNA_ID=CAMNT_0043532567 /DNA_START=44 /DNA_END=250 /DNA_ORIENTATION=+